MPLAPLPVAYSPETMTVSIDGREMTFTDVDLNVWFAEALSLAKTIEPALVPFDGTLAPLVEIPAPPNIVSQMAEAAKRAHDGPAALALWNYSFAYEASRDEHDEVIAYAEAGTATPSPERRAPNDGRLFRALARFHLLHAEATPELFAEMVDEIAVAYAAHHPGEPPPDPAGSGEKAEATFNIFTTRSARAIVKVVRNRAAEAFRFVTETSASITAPRLSHDSFDLATVPGSSIADRLDAFFRALLGDAKATVRIGCFYRYDDVSLPVVLLADQTLEEGWAEMFMKVAEEWKASQQPPPGTFTFDVTVSDDGVPLIDVHMSAGEGAGAPLRTDN